MMGIQKSLFNLNFIMILKLHAKEVEYKNIMFILVLAITFYIAFLDYSKYLEKVLQIQYISFHFTSLKGQCHEIFELYF